MNQQYIDLNIAEQKVWKNYQHQIQQIQQIKQLIQQQLYQIQHKEVCQRLQKCQEDIKGLKNELILSRNIDVHNKMIVNYETLQEKLDKLDKYIHKLQNKNKKMDKKLRMPSQQQICYHRSLRQTKSKLISELALMAVQTNQYIDQIRQQIYQIKKQIRLTEHTPPQKDTIQHNQILKRIKNNPDVINLIHNNQDNQLLNISNTNKINQYKFQRTLKRGSRYHNDYYQLNYQTYSPKLSTRVFRQHNRINSELQNKFLQVVSASKSPKNFKFSPRNTNLRLNTHDLCPERSHITSPRTQKSGFLKHFMLLPKSP